MGKWVVVGSQEISKIIGWEIFPNDTTLEGWWNWGTAACGVQYSERRAGTIARLELHAGMSCYFLPRSLQSVAKVV